jgi:hypothetical protein
MKLPEYITSELGDTYRIVDSKNDLLILENNSYLYSYNITTNNFIQIKNGLMVSAGLKAKDNNKYVK